MVEVWRFDVAAGERIIWMPVGARLLSVGVSNAQVSVWALVDPHAARERRSVVVVETGRRMPERLSAGYVGTVVVALLGGDYVLHVFDGGVVAS